MRKKDKLTSRGCYRVIVDTDNESPPVRRGFSQVVKLCKNLRSAKADYTVDWDTPETGVFILFSIPAKARKRVCTRPAMPAAKRKSAAKDRAAHSREV